MRTKLRLCITRDHSPHASACVPWGNVGNRDLVDGYPKALPRMYLVDYDLKEDKVLVGRVLSL